MTLHQGGDGRQRSRPPAPHIWSEDGRPAVSAPSIGAILWSTRSSEVQEMPLAASKVLFTSSQVSDFVLHSGGDLLQSVAQLHLLGRAVLLQRRDDLMTERTHHYSLMHARLDGWTMSWVPSCPQQQV